MKYVHLFVFYEGALYLLRDTQIERQADRVKREECFRKS